MKVVVPSTPADAKGLMTSAIRDDNPVVYIFHKGVMGLPWMVKNPRSIDEVPDGEHTVPIGEARVAREGSDVTVVTSRYRSTTRSTSPTSWPRTASTWPGPAQSGSARPDAIFGRSQDRPAGRRRRGLPVVRGLMSRRDHRP
jgi:hypothetical protein